MNSSSELQLRVAAHFDTNVSLYTDKYESSYSRMCEERLAQLSQYLNNSDQIRLFDIGCGSGLFTDKFLSEYRNATACCMDFSRGMLAKNKFDSRKTLVCGNAKALPFWGQRFDLINIDAVMHHMIEPDGYERSVSSISTFLDRLREVSSPRGLLAVREIAVQGVPWGRLAPRMIYGVSTMRLPDAGVRLLRKFGLETAGVGVAFLTKRNWMNVFHNTGWSVIDAMERPWENSWKRPGLRVSDMFYVCRKAETKN